MNCAIYVDADNVSYKNVEEILSRANNCNIIIKKIYADWTDESMKKWAEKAKNYGFQGIQCFGNEKKQTSDVYMVTDIVSDLYNNNFIEMVILATSDIDFTHLCHLIKQKNKKLVIFAPQKSNITNLTTETNEYPTKIKKKRKLKENTEFQPKLENKLENKLESLPIVNDLYINYLTEAMKDNISIYISKYKKNLRKIVPKGIKGLDINHIDKILSKYPKHFKLIKKGNKIKIYGIFKLHHYSQKDFEDKIIEIENKYSEIFKIFNKKEISRILF